MRTWQRDILFIALLGLVVHGAWALRLEHPSYFDAYYYTTNAQRLANGEGFTEAIIWQYLDDPAGIPTASHTYWMPLASIIAAAGYTLTETFRGAQLPFWIMAGLLPLLSYVISWRLVAARWQARAAGLFTAAGGYYAAYWAQPSTFVLFAWVGGGCLLALALAARGERRLWWLAAGVGSGLAHLTRADGLLLLVVGGWLWLARRRRSNVGLPALLFLAVGYLAVMAGWFWHTWRISGQLLSTVGTQTIFLTTYDDVFAYGRTFDSVGYLDWGWENILKSKLDAVWLAVQTFIGVTGLTAFTFFVAVGWVGLRRRESQRQFLFPATLYTVLLFSVMSLVFTFPGQRGSLLHSSTAVWPWSMALLPAGLDFAVDWMAKRRPKWQPRQAKKVFSFAFVIFVFAVSVFVAGELPLQDKEAAVYARAAALLPPDSVVMTGDPPGFHYHTGLPAVVTPNEPPRVLPRVAQRYGVDYLLLDGNRPKPLASLYDGDQSIPELEFVTDLGDGYHLYAFAAP